MTPLAPTPQVDTIQKDVSQRGLVELVVRRPDVVALVGIVLTAAAAWVWLIGSPSMQGSMSSMEMVGMDMSGMGMANEPLLLIGMWAVMMVAMMLPSAAPMILLYSRIGATRAARGTRYTPVAFFAVGYLIVWWAFSAIAGLVQWALHSAAILSPGMTAANPFVAAGIMISAGVYQWLPVKQVCLSHCRSPLGFLTSSWREGRTGALIMGMSHGSFCVGCCWMLMALLFVAGVMNLVWVAALTGIVIVEKFVPAGAVIARATGVLFVIIGIALIAGWL